jgi:hypothetical protein
MPQFWIEENPHRGSEWTTARRRRDPLRIVGAAV